MGQHVPEGDLAARRAVHIQVMPGWHIVQSIGVGLQEVQQILNNLQQWGTALTPS